MTRLIDSDEIVYDLPFPLGGIDRSTGFGEQRPGTTQEGVNVRSVEPIGHRARGGQRPGLEKYLNDMVPPTADAIQDLNLLVIPDGDALGISFDDVAVQDTAFQLTDPSGARALLGDLSTGWVYVGGSGYHTPNTYVRTYRPRVDSVSPSEGDFDGAETITITGANLGNTNSTVDFGGNAGTVLSNDGSTMTATSPSRVYPEANAQVDVLVTSNQGTGTSQNTSADNFTYKRIRHIQNNTASYANSVAAKTVAFTSNVKAGNLLLLILKTYRNAAPPLFATVTVADTLLNSWTQVGSYLQPFAAANDSVSIWYAVANGAGANTVTYTPSHEILSHAAVMEYSDPHQTTPLDGSSTNSSSASTAWSTGSVAVSGTDELLLGVFYSSSASTSMTPADGFTSRISEIAASISSALYVIEKTGNVAAANPSGTGAASVYFLGFGVSFKPKPP